MAPIKPIGQAPPVRGEPYIGLLKSGLVAIGGETTGWSLTLDEPVKLPTGVRAAALEVDVSRVIESARAFDGRRVRAQGTVVNRRFVERGEVPVLSISDLRLSEQPHPR